MTNRQSSIHRIPVRSLVGWKNWKIIGSSRDREMGQQEGFVCGKEGGDLMGRWEAGDRFSEAG